MSNLKLEQLLPLLGWARSYTQKDLGSDVIAGVIVLFITIPQVIAYAFLAGVPAANGLYAAILALLCYAAFGSSRTLAVGPTAIISMMTLEVVSRFAEPHTAAYGLVTIKLALVTGGLLVVLRVLNFGAVISFLSHAVVTGFITAAAILIIANQVPSLLGIAPPPDTAMMPLLEHIAVSMPDLNLAAVWISVGALVLLLFCKLALGDLLAWFGLPAGWINSLVRSAPMYAVVTGILVVAGFGLAETWEVAVVGAIPTQLPDLSMVRLSLDEVSDLLPSALLISMVVFMESTSVGTAVASKRRQKIDPNQELLGLGVANLGSSFAGGFPVAGSFARTVVNFSSGAVTPVASIVTALLVILTLALFASLFFYLPKAVLSAIIVLSASQLVDLHAIRKIFSFNAIDAVTFSFTFLAVLAMGVEMGILAGIVISFVLLIRASSRPHIAVVGRWGNTEHFRSVARHEVQTSPRVLAVRIDESLYFVNTRYIETFLLNRVAESEEIEHVLLICTATNFIDSSGLEMLELLSDNLAEVGVTLHLSEIKGPVMDRLKKTEFYERMTGKVFFTTDIAMRELGDI
ncbi:MAG: SulP family inorganic anion transporter [Pseudomonadota bacterium]